jgi:hypothetical protein
MQTQDTRTDLTSVHVRFRSNDAKSKIEVAPIHPVRIRTTKRPSLTHMRFRHETMETIMTNRIFRKATITSAFTTRKDRRNPLDHDLEGQIDTRTGTVRGPMDLLI